MPETGTSAISEWVRAIIGLFIVFFVVMFLTIIYWYKSIDDFKTVSATLIGLVTTVLGFYFGVKGTDDANKRADEANQGLTQAKKMVTKGGGIATQFLILSKQIPQIRSLAENEEIRQLLSECEVFVNDVKRTGLLIDIGPIQRRDS